MQLGTRWTAGDEPPSAVPASIRPAIAEVERELMVTEPRPRWTLTFLERRPVAELDTGVIVTLASDGTAVVRHDPDDDYA